MTVLLIDGFDSYPTSGADMTSRGWSADSNSFDVGRLGSGKSARFLPNHATQIGFPATTSFGVGFAMKCNANALDTAGGGGTPLFQVLSGSSSVLTFYYYRNGDTVLNNANGNFGAAGAGSIINGKWNYFEVAFDTVANTCTFKMNGATISTSTGGHNFSSGTVNGFLISGIGNGHGDESVWWDDLYITDGATLGECRVDVLRPTADTAAKAFTPNSGSTNYTQVADTTYDGDTTYNSSSTVGDIDLFDCNDMPITPVAIYAAQAVIVAKKDVSGSRGLRTKLKSSTSTADGVTQGLTTDYLINTDIYAVDPHTSAAWTLSALNLAQVGYEVVS